MNWLFAVFSLRMRPAPNALTKRVTPHRSELRIDAHLGELRAERVHRVTLLLIARLRVGAPFDRVGAVLAQHRDQRIAARAVQRGRCDAVERGELRAHVERGELERRARARGQRRAARVRRVRKRGVAELHAHALDRDAERLGDDLREHGVRAGADVDARAAREHACRRRAAAPSPTQRCGSSDSVAAATPIPTSMPPSRIERGRGSRRLQPIRSAPARSACTSDRLENGSPSASCATSLRTRSSTGSIVERVRELVDRRLERERAARLAGRAHVGRRRGVQPHRRGASPAGSACRTAPSRAARRVRRTHRTPTCAPSSGG